MEKYFFLPNFFLQGPKTSVLGLCYLGTIGYILIALLQKKSERRSLLGLAKHQILVKTQDLVKYQLHIGCLCRCWGLCITPKDRCFEPKHVVFFRLMSEINLLVRFSLKSGKKEVISIVGYCSFL